MATTISSSILSPTFLLLQNPTKISPKISFQFQPTINKLTHPSLNFTFSPYKQRSNTSTRFNVVAEETSTVSTTTTEEDSSAVSSRRLYVGNIPRNLTNDELLNIVQEHGAVEKAEVMYDKWSGRSRRFAFVTMKTVEDATAAIEKLNGTEIGGREIKVNITEKPLTQTDSSNLQAEESQFVDSPYKVYVANLAKGVTTDSLKNFFAEKGNVLSAKVSRVPGTSKSSGYGFVTFSSEEDVEAAISSLNDAVLDGQKIRVNKA